MENVKTIKAKSQEKSDEKLLDVLNQIFPLTKPTLQKSKAGQKSETTVELQINKVIENQEKIFEKIHVLETEVKQQTRVIKNQILQQNDIKKKFLELNSLEKRIENLEKLLK